MSQYENVSVVKQANVYFDGKCVSHTVQFADGTRKSIGVILPAYDLSLIRQRQRGARGAAAELYAAAYSRQTALVYLTLGGLLVTIILVVLVSVFSDFFIRRHKHVILGFGLLAYILFLVSREIRQLNKMRGKILRKTAAQIAEGH